MAWENARDPSALSDQLQLIRMCTLWPHSFTTKDGSTLGSFSCWVIVQFCSLPNIVGQAKSTLRPRCSPSRYALKLKSSIFMPKYSRLGCVSWPYSLTAKDGNTHGSYSCRIVLCSQPSDGKELCKPSRWTVVISTLIEKLQYQEYTVKDEFPATKRTIGTPSFALKMQCLSSSKKHGHVVGHWVQGSC